MCLIDPDATGKRVLAGITGGLPAWSPDSKWIAYVDLELRIAVVHADGSGVHQLPPHIDDKNQDCNLAWSPDGKQIAFTPEPAKGIYFVDLDSTHHLTALKAAGDDICGVSWAATG